jgi:hypothetical protein
LSDNWQQKRTQRERVSYETKLTSGNEADRNQSAMKEVKVKTTTERDKTPRRCRQKRTLVSLAGNPCYEAETIFESIFGVLTVSCICSRFVTLQTACKYHE